MSTALTTPQTFRDYMRSDEFRIALTESMAKHVDPERLMRVAVSCLTKNTALQDCSQASLVQCVIDAARIGLEPGISVLGHCWMVPYEVKDHSKCDHDRKQFNCRSTSANAELQVGYRGKAELFRRAVPGGRLQARVWRKNDVFKPEEGTEPRLIHKWDPNDPRGRGPVQGYYAVAYYPDGFRMFDTMTVGEVEEVRQKYSKSKNSPAWTKSFDEMGKAKVCTRLEKWLELSIEQIHAHDLDEESQVIVPAGRVEVQPEEPIQPRTTTLADDAAQVQKDAKGWPPGQAPASLPPAQQPNTVEKPKRSRTLEKAQAAGGVKPSSHVGEPPPEASAAKEEARRDTSLPEPEHLWHEDPPSGLDVSGVAAWLAMNARPPYAQCDANPACVRKKGHQPTPCTTVVGKAGVGRE